jgi:hypothetical protein
MVCVVTPRNFFLVNKTGDLNNQFDDAQVLIIISSTFIKDEQTTLPHTHLAALRASTVGAKHAQGALYCIVLYCIVLYWY